MHYRNRKPDKLHDINKHESTNPPFAESLAKLIQRHSTQHNLKKIQREIQHTKSKSAPETQPLLCGRWPIPDKLYDTLDACLDIERILHCNPYIQPTTKGPDLLLGRPTKHNVLFRTTHRHIMVGYVHVPPGISAKQTPDRAGTSHLQRPYPQKPHSKPNHSNPPRLEPHSLTRTKFTHQLRTTYRPNLTHAGYPAPTPP